MSTFGGIVREIPNISVDRFDGVNLMSTAYFLSHCHKDHMKGLDDKAFLSRLGERGIHLYCSEISYHILMNTKIESVKESVKILSYQMEAIIEVPPNEMFSQPQNVTVTVIPAGHCPGSVMFLFDSVCGRILYTGDIRLREGDISKMKPFQNRDGNVKTIQTMYLDTTFLDPIYKYFPPRNVSANSFCKLVADWINKNVEHCVLIKLPAKHGSEYLFMEIFKSLKTKVHINFDHFHLYRNVPELEPAITASSGLTQVHACSVCPILREKRKQGLVRVIKPSAMWFRNCGESNSIVKETGQKYFKVAYSSHSSYNELIDIIRFLEPKKIVPCVIPPGRSREDVNITLRNIHKLIDSKWELVVESNEKDTNSNLELKRFSSGEYAVSVNSSGNAEDNPPKQPKLSRLEENPEIK